MKIGFIYISLSGTLKLSFHMLTLDLIPNVLTTICCNGAGSFKRQEINGHTNEVVLFSTVLLFQF